MDTRTAQLVALALLLAGATKTKAQVVYDVASDFSVASNPNGVWSYGYLAPAATPNASTFTFYPNGFVAATGAEVWDITPTSAPLDEYNPTNMVLYASNSYPLQPHQAAFHPGPNGEYTDYRFTAPSSGTFTLSATFMGGDVDGPTAPDPVYILDNGSIMFSGSVQAYQSTASDNTTLPLNSGDVLDFLVGDGPPGNVHYANNTTDLAATLSSVPEPGSLILCSTGALGLIGYARSRRKGTDRRRV